MRISLAVLVLILMGQDARAVDLIAHRGYSCGGDENSQAAIVRAWRAGASIVEVDVRVSADGVVYLFHDDEIDGDPVSKQAFGDLQRRTEQSLQTLDTLLNSGAPRGRLLLDLKDSKGANFGSLVNLIKGADMPHNKLLMQSPDIEVLTDLRQQLPKVQFYYLSRLSRKPPFFQKPRASTIIDTLEGHGLSGVSLKGRRFLGREFISTIQDAGYRVNVWTINDAQRAAHYERSGVDGIITDKLAEFSAVESLCVSVAVR